MKAPIKIIGIIVLLLPAIYLLAYAGWTEPVPVQELNMSGDELTALSFSRRSDNDVFGAKVPLQ